MQALMVQTIYAELNTLWEHSQVENEENSNNHHNSNYQDQSNDDKIMLMTSFGASNLSRNR